MPVAQAGYAHVPILPAAAACPRAGRETVPDTALDVRLLVQVLDPGAETAAGHGHCGLLPGRCAPELT